MSDTGRELICTLCGLRFWSVAAAERHAEASVICRERREGRA